MSAIRCEVIIAARGELPLNLSKTVENVRATMGKNDAVRVVLDGRHPYKLHMRCQVDESPWERPRGCGQTRHYGMTTSKARYVVLIDGHMRFPAGWLDAIARHLSRNPRDITCTVNQSIGHKWQTLDAAEYDSGAQLHLHDTGPQTEIGGPAREFYGLSAKWNGGRNPGVVAAPMGACYGMRRDWYDRIGQPLGILEAWGQDEELLGVCGWLCGGRTYCLPVVTEHMYAAPNTGRIADPEGKWAERLAVLRAIPGMPSETERHLRSTGTTWGLITPRVDCRVDRIEALRAHLGRQKRTFADMIAAGLVTVHPPRAAETPSAPERPAAVQPGASCRYCGPTVERGGKCGLCGSRAIRS